MGKKNRKQQQQAKRKLCFTLNDRSSLKTVEEIWERTSNWSGMSSVAPPLASLWNDYDAVTSLLDRLKRRQGGSPVPLPPRKDGIKEFKEWLKKNGAAFDKVEIAEFPGGGGLGLRVVDQVEESEKVLQIPDTVMLSWEEALKPPLAAFIQTDPLLSAMPNLALAVVLLNERYNPDSFWKPYINVLPQSFDLPLFYSKEELEPLIGSPVLTEAISQLRNISRLYAIIYQRLRTHNNPELFIGSVGFNYEDFVWAVSCVMTRQNRVPTRKSGDQVLVMIPFWDMANHALGKVLTDYEIRTRSCVCYSMRRFSPGEEFLIFYGQRGNADLFLNQGFTYDENPYDTVKIPVGVSRMEDSGSRQLRQKLLEKIRIQVPGHLVVKHGTTPFPPELMAFTRIFTAPPDLLKEWNDMSREKLCRALLSMNLYRKDIKVMEFLENRCSLLLQPYKTTLEEDEQLLLKPDLPYRTRCLVVLRAGEKRILKNAAALARSEREGIEKKLDKVKDTEHTNSDHSEASSKEDETTDVLEIETGPLQNLPESELKSPQPETSDASQTKELESMKLEAESSQSDNEKLVLSKSENNYYGLEDTKNIEVTPTLGVADQSTA